MFIVDFAQQINNKQILNNYVLISLDVGVNLFGNITLPQIKKAIEKNWHSIKSHSKYISKTTFLNIITFIIQNNTHTKGILQSNHGSSHGIHIKTDFITIYRG